MLKLVSFIDSLPRVRKSGSGNKSSKKSTTAAVKPQKQQQPDDLMFRSQQPDDLTFQKQQPDNLMFRSLIINKKSSCKSSYKNILSSKIGKRRSTAPDNVQIEKDLDCKKLVENYASLENGKNNKELDFNDSGNLPKPVINYNSNTLPLNRPQIRTNPWCKPKLPTLATLDFNRNTLPRATDGKRAVGTGSGSGPVDDPETPSTITTVMSGSVTSSGYGSRDSSPASSVHSPDWQNANNVGNMQISLHSDIGLQCNMMTEDKANYCSEADFEFDTDSVIRYADDDSSESESGFGVLVELNHKIADFRKKSKFVEKCAEMAKQERERRNREKQLCQEQMTFIKQFKLAISNGFEVVV